MCDECRALFKEELKEQNPWVDEDFNNYVHNVGGGGLGTNDAMFSFKYDLKTGTPWRPYDDYSLYDCYTEILLPSKPNWSIRF